MKSRVHAGDDGLNQVVRRLPVEDEEAEVGLTPALVDEHGALDEGPVPLVVVVLVMRCLGIK